MKGHGPSALDLCRGAEGGNTTLFSRSGSRSREVD